MRALVRPGILIKVEADIRNVVLLGAWGVIEPRPDDRGWRAEVHNITMHTILYRFEAVRRPKKCQQGGAKAL